jgi:hypothetical protein
MQVKETCHSAKIPLFYYNLCTRLEYENPAFKCRPCLPENLLLGVRPHVDKLALVVEEERVGGEPVVVDKLAAALLRRQQRRRYHSIRVHLLLLHLINKKYY